MTKISLTKSMKLNKYVAHAGITSRRKAVDLIKHGEILVNGKPCTVPYYEVQEKDVVKYKGKTIKPTTKKIYLLLNKPKNVISTTSDEKGRKSVIDLAGPFKENKLFTIGRLDRNTTGLIILTNDGDLTHKLAHPSSSVKKIYHVFLDRKIIKSDLDNLRKGVKLEDGFIQPDALNLTKDGSGQELGVELHSGRNRIIRRMFEHLNYEVVKLDRVYFAGLTKKDLPRGRFRELTERELIMLRHFT